MTKLEIALAIWLLIQVPLGCLIGWFISVGAGGDPVLQEETDEAGVWHCPFARYDGMEVR